MKALTAFLLLFIIFFQPLSAGWKPQNTDSNNKNDFLSVFCTDSMNAWVVGGSAQILKTTDGGENWETINHGIIDKGTFTDIMWTEDGTGWVSCKISVVNGLNGKIAKSIDGGKTLIPYQIFATEINSIFFKDSLTGWACGSYCTGKPPIYGVILKTTNGGIIWSEQKFYQSPFVDHITFSDSVTGWAIIPTFAVFNTKDAGTNWDSKLYRFYLDHSDVFFLDSLKGWVSAYQYATSEEKARPVIFYSNNGGADWIEKSENIPFSPEKIFFTDSTTGWIAGNKGQIAKTKNNGDTWLIENSGTNEDILCLFFPNSRKGWAVGKKGTILKYTHILDEPGIISPIENKYIDSDTVTLSWNSVRGADYYRINLSRSPEFRESIIDTTSSETKWFTEILQKDSVYYWRVNAVNNEDESSWSEVGKFTTKFISGISTDIPKTNLKIIPNPAVEYLTVCFNLSIADKTLISVTNILGHSVFSTELSSLSTGDNEISIDISNFPTGIYFLRIQSGNYLEVVKFLKGL